MLQVRAGLAHLHGLGVIHRDLRSANVVLEERHPLHLRIVDVGLSHQLAAMAVDGPRYMGPNQLQAEIGGDAAAGPVQVRT